MNATRARYACLLAALAVGLSCGSPAWGQEDAESRPSRRGQRPPADQSDDDSRPVRRKQAAPPKVTAGEHYEPDADLEPNPCTGTALDLTESLGIALNRVAMGKPDGQDLKNFRKRRELQQKKFPDAPGYEMLNKAVVPAERELVRGYNGLVEKGLVPLAAAGVFVDGAISDLHVIAEQGSAWMKDIDDVTDALERVVAGFDAESFAGGEQSIDLSTLKAREQDMPELKERLKVIKDQVCRADVLVRAAAEGPKLGLQHAARARELAQKADDFDAEAISRTTGDRTSDARETVREAQRRDSDAMNCASGNCPSRRSTRLGGSAKSSSKRAGVDLDSIEGRSGPVIADGAEKLERASEQTEAARKATDLVSNPSRGKIMKVVLALDKAADLAIAAGGDAPSGGGKGGQGGGGCASCAGGCTSAGTSLRGLRARYAKAETQEEKDAILAEAAAIVAKTKESFAGVKDEVKAARNAAEKAKGKLADATATWDGIVEKELGLRDKDTAESKLPRLPEPNADVKTPGRSQAYSDTPTPPRKRAARSDDEEAEGSEEAEGIAPKSKPKARSKRSSAPDQMDEIDMDADQQFRRFIRKGGGKSRDSE